jgi:hypothetical protein
MHNSAPKVANNASASSIAMSVTDTLQSRDVQARCAGQFQCASQTPERRAQVVGNVGENLAQALHKHIDAVQQDIKIRSQPVELAAASAPVAAARWQPHVELSVHDPLARTIDRLDTSQYARTHRQAARYC